MPARATSQLFPEYLRLAGVDAEFAEVAAFGPGDALLVVDMQADLLPKDPKTNPEGGHLGTEGGFEIVQPIRRLIEAAIRAGSTVCATRGYHPHDHISFSPQPGSKDGMTARSPSTMGHFPPHCVQGTPGSNFLPLIAEALEAGVRKLGHQKVFVAFKGMHEQIGGGEGALPYWDVSS